MALIVTWFESSLVVLSFVMIDACGVPNPDLNVAVTDIMDLYGSEMGWKHTHDDVISWKSFPHYWPFVRGIHQYNWWIPLTKRVSNVDLDVSLFWTWPSCWTNSRFTSYFRWHDTHQCGSYWWNMEPWGFFVFNLTKQLNKQWSCVWVEMPWCSCEVTVINVAVIDWIDPRVPTALEKSLKFRSVSRSWKNHSISWKVLEICKNEKIMENHWISDQLLMEKSLNSEIDIVLTNYMGKWICI